MAGIQQTAKWKTRLLSTIKNYAENYPTIPIVTLRWQLSVWASSWLACQSHYKG